MTIPTPTRLPLAGILVFLAPLAVAQRSIGHGRAVGREVGVGGLGVGSPPASGVPAAPQIPSNGLMTGGHGGPILSTRASNSGNAPTLRNSSPFGLSSRWWNDQKTAKQLSLRREQQQRMDRIFDGNRNNLTSLYNNLQAEETKLRSLSSKDREDETKLLAAIDRVTQARAQLQKASGQIVVQLHQQLDAPQISLMEEASR